MSEFEAKRDKSKGFKATQETVEKINAIIKKSGKNDNDFFEELVNDLVVGRLVDEDNEEISPDLRKHFTSDVQKLKNATNSIISIFTSQMENIAVEKDKWSVHTDKLVTERDEKIKELQERFDELKTNNNMVNHEFAEITKVNGLLEKERAALEKRTEDQELLIQDRNEKIQELNERVNKLNETIVDSNEQLKEVQTIREEKKRLEEQSEGLIQSIEQLKERHKEELQKTKERLEFECEKSKHQLEVSLKEEFDKQKEEVRDTTRRETEKAIGVFYLKEIERRDKEFFAKEEEYRKDIDLLNQEIAELKKQKSRSATRTQKDKEQE